jgi:hypothetical protein
MIIAPTLRVVGPSGSAIDFGQGAVRSDLFGTLRSPSGALMTGGDAARAPFLAAPTIATRGVYRFNACDIAGGGCSPAVELGRFENPIDDPILGYLIEVPLVTSENQSFVSLPPPDEEDDETEDGIGSPITGSGNEDLWTTPVEVPAP